MARRIRQMAAMGLLFALIWMVRPVQWAAGQTSAKSSSKSKSPMDKNAVSGKSSTAAKSSTPAKKDSAGSVVNPFPKRIVAPGLEGGREWLNTAGEITLRDLRGKVVLLDFWTYCCINCMHILPDLSYLEKKYPAELVVIGVHSGKFRAEKDQENIRKAIIRYEIEHPVINDADMTLWNKFQVNTWPTFVLIDPEGYFCGMLAGEGNRENLDKVIERVVAYHRSKGTLDETPLHFDLEAQRAPDTPLRFPGKILADGPGKRLFISDSNHNRIVVTDLAGKFLYTIGSGAIGNKDGGYDVAQFDHPQGVELDGNQLYIADTENHLIRMVDLDKRQVKTVAGTGRQSHQFRQGGSPLQTALASPWDIKKLGSKLYIAMAGLHQVWVLNGTESIRPYAGSGKEDILNGALTKAALAQPSGICTDGEFLYVVDSEGSAIRKIATKLPSQVSTLVGTADLPSGRCLFEFGDIDGVGNQVRLQHPLGIAYRKGSLYVADAYNNKIKVIDIAKRSCRTLLPLASGATTGETKELFEPAGLSIAGDKMFIADTNNHRILAFDFATQQLSTLEMAGLQVPPPASVEDELPTIDKPIQTTVQTVVAGSHLQFDVKLDVPEGFKLNPLAAVVFRLQAEGKQTLVAAEHLGTRLEVKPTDDRVAIQVPLAAKTGAGEFRLFVSYSYCKEQAGGVCKLKRAAWLVPVTLAQTGDKSIELMVE